MQLNDFDFDFNENLIAINPPESRSDSRLLVVKDKFFDRKFSDIVDLLDSKDVIVFNDTKVIKALLYGTINGSKASINLHQSFGESAMWYAFAKPGRKFKSESIFKITENFYAKVIKKIDSQIQLEFNCAGDVFFNNINIYGEMPLPPYIEKKRKPSKIDEKNYQTIYANKPGAVAAPTAGLHFSEEILQKLIKKKINIAYVTLHVGAGTFLPVKTEDISQHKMHSEYISLSSSDAQKINNAKISGGRVIAVGTTSMRVLESIASDEGVLKSYEGFTDIFITPGYKFKIVDILITNFHLPKSTLFMLVCAFAGFDKMHLAYSHAVKKEYRFFSYGDACFLHREG